MQVIFTLCSNNYLPQALVLADAVKKFQPAACFVIGLVDRFRNTIHYADFAVEVIEAVEVEPSIEALAQKFSIVELNTCLKPAFFQYFFEVRGAKQVIYLDPDIQLFHSMNELDSLLEQHEIILTPHTLTPLPLDDLRPNEPLFLNYGIYNLGFLALKQSHNVLSFLKWWKQRTYALGYDCPAEGLFTDQLWMNLVPIYFENVLVLRNPGYNMAPWNLHERQLVKTGKDFIVNDAFPLVFYHFSSIVLGNNLLHREYNRFLPGSRPDLDELYLNYRESLEKKGYARLRSQPCFYAQVREQVLKDEASHELKRRQQQLNALPYHKKMLKRIRARIPARIKNFLKD